ncbi:MAG: hypothetical protein GY797_34700 [Deltaproteobacteria bacterium]|nr:hypothetical protein [Deltaproteobacteria bacterium]MCP5007152.1 hypothetical protein [Planctomycetota bacterium]
MSRISDIFLKNTGLTLSEDIKETLQLAEEVHLFRLTVSTPRRDNISRTSLLFEIAKLNTDIRNAIFEEASGVWGLYAKNLGLEDFEQPFTGNQPKSKRKLDFKKTCYDATGYFKKTESNQKQSYTPLNFAIGIIKKHQDNMILLQTSC